MVLGVQKSRRYDFIIACFYFKLMFYEATIFNLDALRGYAIFTMILSGSIAHGGILPPWMFHAQVPPPNHQFNPNLPGITWVDLVFPFLFFVWVQQFRLH